MGVEAMKPNDQVLCDRFGIPFDAERLVSPILMKPPLAQASREGAKTETRRLVTADHVDWFRGSKTTPFESIGAFHENKTGKLAAYLEKFEGVSVGEMKAPYGWPGDYLWLRETWGDPSADHPRCKGGRKPQPGDKIVYRGNPADAWQWRGGDGCGDFVWRTPLHLPKWACRTMAKVVSVRIERVRNITEEGAKAEGVYAWLDSHEDADAREGARKLDAENLFRILWDSINMRRAPWFANPFVWVIGYEVILPVAERQVA